MDRGGQQTCVIGKDANGYCPAGTYFDGLAGMCAAPNGAPAPYGIDNVSLAQQTYAGCAAGYNYNEGFQCCQAVTGGTYPGCPAGTTFNADLGACSPENVQLSGEGCITVRVTTLKCSDPVDVCSGIVGESPCIQNNACAWDEKANSCKIK